jgi:hypothetical protein
MIERLDPRCDVPLSVCCDAWVRSMGVKQTSRHKDATSACDPERTTDDHDILGTTNGQDIERTCE